MICQTHFSNEENKIILSDDFKDLMEKTNKSFTNKTPLWGRKMINWFLNQEKN